MNWQRGEDQPMTARDIIHAVAVATGVTETEITGAYRHRHLARARFLAAHLISDRLKYSTPRIGRALGGRDHTTVIHALRQAGKLMREDAEFRSARRRALSWIDCGRRQPRAPDGVLSIGAHHPRLQIVVGLP